MDEFIDSNDSINIEATQARESSAPCIEGRNDPALAPLSCACRVLVRLRPFPEVEAGEWTPLSIGDDGKSVIVRGGEACPVYTMDGVLPASSTQADVFSSIQESLLCVMHGMNATLLAYGQTNAGKTYTLFGKNEREKVENWDRLTVQPNCSTPMEDSRGVVSRALDLVFDRIAQDTRFVHASLCLIHLDMQLDAQSCVSCCSYYVSRQA